MQHLSRENVDFTPPGAQNPTVRNRHRPRDQKLWAPPEGLKIDVFSNACLNPLFGAFFSVLGGSWGVLGRSWGAKCRPSWFGRVSGHDFGEILVPADMKMYGFSLGKSILFRKSTFSIRNAILACFCLRFYRSEVLLGASWRPIGCPWPLLGLQGVLLGCLRGPLGPLQVPPRRLRAAAGGHLGT